MNRNQVWIKSLLVITALILETGVWAQETVPAHAKATAEGKAAGHSIKSWVVDKERGKYVAVLSNGAVMEIDMKGKWLRTSTPISEQKLPPLIVATVDKYVGDGYEVDNYIRIEDATDGDLFAVDITSDDEDATLLIDKKGKVLRKEGR
jgi:hypothetical protein